MLSNTPDFGDLNDIYKQLKTRRSGNIIFQLEIDDKNPFVPGISYELAKEMGVKIRRDGSIDKDDLKKVIVNKFKSLNSKRIEFLVENVQIGEPKHEGGGRWRLRVRPDLKEYEDVTFLDHTLVIVCVRKSKRLYVTKISMDIMPRRPHIAEGLLSGPVNIFEGQNSSFLTDEDFKWLNGLIKRKDSIEKRLIPWEKYLEAHLNIIKNKEGWLVYRNLQRISPTQASIEVNTRLYSRNANKSFYPQQDVNIIKGVPIPTKDDWKPDEDVDEPIFIGAFEKGCPIRSLFNDQSKKKNDWITLNIDLIDRYIWAPGTDNNSIKDPLERLTFPSDGIIINSVLKDQLPLMLQQKAIDRLKEINSANCRLEDFLFNIKEARLPTRDEDINRETLVEKNLNDNQFLALKKSLNTPDIALIQGPPGTGKTTVIAELCNQVTLRRGRVLIASQSNLAVYNALSRLSNKNHIMPIRIGRSWKPEEGEDEFEEENVIRRWFTGIRQSMEIQTNKIDSITNDLTQYKNSINELELSNNSLKEIITKKNNLDIILKNIKNQKEKISAELDELGEVKTENEQVVNLLKKSLNPVDLSYDEMTKVVKKFPTITRHLYKKVEILSNLYDTSELKDKPAILCGLYVNLATLKRNIDQLENGLNKIYELVEAAHLYLEANEKIVELQQKRAKLNKDMDNVTDASDQGIFLEIIEINKQIKQLEADNKASKLEEQWKSELIGISRYIDILISFEKTLGHKPIEDVSLEDLKSSLRPDKKYEKMVHDLIELANSIKNGNFNFDRFIKAELEDLIDNQEKKLNNVIDVINEKENESETVDKQISKTQEEVADIDVSTEQITNKINADLGIIYSLRQKYLNDLNDQENTARPRKLNEKFVDQLKFEYDNVYNKEKDSIEDNLQWKDLRAEWIKRIKKSEENPSKDDYEDVKEKYIELANVIGATCTETGKYKFWSKHGRDFDLVIIDEVSKATLPELLMPMLLGKQIILVGDHKQLPPIFNINETELTYDEANDSVDTKEEIAEKFKNYKNLVTSSYFAEMFKDADESLRSRLTEQYRMHPTIMRAVNQFYPGEYTLTCGLKDPDKERSHPYVIKTNTGRASPENTHLVWVDSSYKMVDGRKIANYENREDKFKQGVESRYNIFEVDIIINLLKQIDSQCNVENGNKQEIAVISFYMGQIRKLRERINALRKSGNLKNLNIRTGSVDRFQGMERPIVIASLVSSPSPQERRQTPTGHVKDFRRINVAFSRAQSLLIVVASADVFSELNIKIDHDGEIIKDMVYKNILSMAEDGADGCYFLGGYEVV